MENNKDFDFIKAQLDTLPAVTLPSSLSAESLWARIDAGELAADEAPKQGSVAEFVRRFRPVLSYAAVFVVMVAVYYSAGLDNSPVNLQSQMDAVPQAADEAAEEPIPMPMMPPSPKMMGAPAPEAAPRMVTGGAESGTQSSDGDMGIAAAQVNPDTAPADVTEDYGTSATHSYIKSLDGASAMEKHLIATLSQKDYGGIYLLHGDAVEMHIWVINQDAVTSAVEAYTGEACSLVFETAGCSLADLKKLAGMLAQIELQEGETLAAYISEMDNAVVVNVSKAGEARLKAEIDTLAQTGGIPKECINVLTVDT